MENAKTNVIFIEHNLPKPYAHVNMLARGKGYFLKEHTHPMFQLIWVIQGVLVLQQNKLKHRMSAGDFCIIPPGSPHALYSESGYKQVGIDLVECGDDQGIVALLEKQITDIVVLDRSDKMPELQDLSEKPKLFTLLSRLQMAHILDSIILSTLQIVNTELNFRDRLLHLMKANLSHNLSIADFSNMLMMSQSSLQRLTKREFGCSVMELNHQLKLNQACSLLLGSDMKIANIAKALGFSDPAYFSRFFKQRMNISPAQFRIRSTI